MQHGDEVRVRVERGVAVAMSEFGQQQGLPEIRWALRRDLQGAWGLDGHVSVGDYAQDECLAVAELWAERLALELNPLSVDGTVEYIGVTDGLRVCVWAVENRYELRSEQ